jgi:Domain of unknown function (DUF1937)
VTRIIYLACPYTHPVGAIRKQRFELATKAAASLIVRDYIVYSPITMTHPLDLVLSEKNQTLGSDFWVKFDEAFMEICSEMIVLILPGWQDSSGIKREIQYFQSHGKKISYKTMMELGA